MRHPAAGLAVPMLLTTVGCGQMAIDGEVVDAHGEPIQGAMITAAGSLCSTLTKEDGKFALECETGTYDVVVSAAGFTTEQFRQEAPEVARYDSGRHLLIRIPEQKGLHLFVDKEYVSMKPARLKRVLEETRKLTNRKVCLDREQSEPNVVAAGTHAIFDYEHPGWRPFRLDEEGCAYRDQKDEKHRWTVTYKEKPPYESKRYNEGKSVALMQLEPGEYFVADWKGFFVGADERDGRHSYTGHWIQAK